MADSAEATEAKATSNMYANFSLEIVQNGTVFGTSDLLLGHGGEGPLDNLEEQMRLVDNLIAAASVALACAVLISPASAAPASRSLTLTKICGAPVTGGELSYCTVTASNFAPLVGAKIRYFGPGFFTEDHPFLDSWVVIEGSGGTAFGHCLVRGVPGPLGACQFTGGSGSLDGFRADVTVTAESASIWHWDGARGK